MQWFKMKNQISELAMSAMAYDIALAAFAEDMPLDDAQQAVGGPDSNICMLVRKAVYMGFCLGVAEPTNEKQAAVAAGLEEQFDAFVKILRETEDAEREPQKAGNLH